MEEFRPLTPQELLAELKERAADSLYFEEYKKPLEFTYNDQTFKHIEGTEKFQLPNSIEEITALNLLKRLEPKIVKSLYRRMVPPETLFKFGLSTRRKISRLAQLHYHKPEIDDRVRSFLPYFEYLSNSKFMGGHYGIGQHYNASLWASDYDKELAAALMLYYGWTKDFKDVPMSGISIHSIEKEPEGVTIHVRRSHTLQDRMNAACTTAKIHLFTARVSPSQDDIIKEAMPTFYSYDHTYISLPNTMHEIIQGMVAGYIKELQNALSEEEPVIPTIEDPPDEQWLQDGDYQINFADFWFQEEASTAQVEQRNTNNAEIVRKILQDKLRGLPIGEPIKRKDIVEYTGDKKIDNNLKAGEKFDYIFKPKYGHYQITEKLFGKE